MRTLGWMCRFIRELHLWATLPFPNHTEDHRGRLKSVNHIVLDLCSGTFPHMGNTDTFSVNLQCWEMLLSPAGVVETTIAVAVEWEPSAFDSFDDTGLKVEMGVRGSGAPEGAVVRWGVASACDTPPEGGGRSSATVAPVPGVNPAGGGAVVVSFLGAAASKGIQKKLSLKKLNFAMC